MQRTKKQKRDRSEKTYIPVGNRVKGHYRDQRSGLWRVEIAYIMVRKGRCKQQRIAENRRRPRETRSRVNKIRPHPLTVMNGKKKKKKKKKKTNLYEEIVKEYRS